MNKLPIEKYGTLKKITIKWFCTKKIVPSIVVTVFLILSTFISCSSITPDFVSHHIYSGECYIESKTVHVPLIPAKADVMFSFDLTISMQEVFDLVKEKTKNIINTLTTEYPDISFTFGVMTYMDYPHHYDSNCEYPAGYYGKASDGDYAYLLNHQLTVDIDTLFKIIDNLSLAHGGDYPEDYTRIFYESYADPAIGWRTDAKKMLINFADNVPHDCDLNEGVPGYYDLWSTGADPGRDEDISTLADNLDLQSVLNEMKENNVILLECQASDYSDVRMNPRVYTRDHWVYWTGLTGGEYYLIESETLVDDIVNTIIEGLNPEKVFGLHLEVTTPGFEDWLTDVDPSSYPEIESNTSVLFNETICVPIGTEPGVYTFIVSALDEDGTNYGNQTNEVTVINDPPIANHDEYTTDEDTDLIITAPGILGNDTDAQNDPLTAIKSDDPTNGTLLSFNVDGSFTYKPNPNYHGTDSFTYRANDGYTDSNIATVSINVKSVNDPPLANDDTTSITEDTSNNPIDVLDNDDDIDGDTLKITNVTQPSHGSSSYTDTIVYYTPYPNYVGEDQLTYSISDNNGGSDSATIRISVTNVNDPPHADEDTSSVLEDSSDNQIDVLANDEDADGDVLDITSVSDPAHGTTTHTADFVYYTPGPDYFGDDQFSYTISDNNGGTDTASVYVTITSINDAPNAVNDEDAVAEDSSNNQIDVLANDDDPDNDNLTIPSVSDPDHGTASAENGDYVYYTPDPNFHGTDQFNYTIDDGHGGSDTASVTVTVSSVNDEPNAVDDYESVAEDSQDNELDVLTNDDDVDGDTLEITGVSLSDHGTVSYSSNIVFYTPDHNFNGPDEFNYTITDGNGGSDTAMVFVMVTSANDPPIAFDDFATFDEDSLDNKIDVLPNDDDIDGDTLTITAVTDADHGSTSYDANYVYYTPDANYHGSDEFTYTVSDGNGGTDIAIITITIKPVNDAPIANDDAVIVDEDSIDYLLPALDNDTDVDDDTLLIANFSSPSNGNATLLNNTLLYTPEPNFHGIDQITYTITDSHGAHDTATIEITVLSINDPPDKPTNPFPPIADLDVEITTLLNWTCGDIDNDSLRYHIYLGTNTTPDLFNSSVSNTSISVSLEYETQYFWKIVAFDTSNASTSSDLWNFTTRNQPATGGGGSSNRNPIADASAGEPYKGFIGENITFDGSDSYDPDGIILKWIWKFGDGTEGTGETTTYNYSENGTYKAILTVEDDRGATDSFTFNVFITRANHPPTKPAVDGPLTGHKNINYTFTARSLDLDNDTICYTFYWGDGNHTKTDYLPNGTSCNQTYKWNVYGAYVITIIAYDGQSDSAIAERTILIDVWPIEDEIEGYLIDEDSEETFDVFENTGTETKTRVERQNDSYYLIDSNADGKWDYAFSFQSGLLNYYRYLYQKYYAMVEGDLETPGFELLSFLAVLVIAFLIQQRKKQRF